MINRFVWLCCFTLIGFCSYGQSLKLIWSDPVTSFDAKGKEISALHFTGATYDSLFLPNYVQNIPGYISSCEVTQVVTKPLSEKEAALVSNYSFPSSPKVVMRYSMLRGVEHTIVNFIPIVSGADGQLVKIVSFELKNTFSASPAKVSNARISVVNNSVLGSGSWVKIATMKSGVYKIDYSFLSAAGFPVNTLDPRTLKVYGNGGGMLPQPNNAYREQDLAENPIWVSGESDGVLNTQDYVLFHAKAQDFVKADSNLSYLVHTNNLYSDSTFYFLTYNQGAGLRVQIASDIPDGQIIRSTDACVFHEKDLSNLAHTGRLWVGEKFDTQTQFNFQFNTPDIVPASSVRVDVSVAIKVKLGYNQHVAFNTVLSNYPSAFNDIVLYGRGSGTNDPVGSQGFATYLINSNSITNNSSLNFTVNFLKNGLLTSAGYLDRINISYQRKLNKSGGQMYVSNMTSTAQAYSTYKFLSAPSDVRIWDITDPVRPVEMSVQQADTGYVFNASSTILRQFIAFDTDFLTPIYIGKVGNQDIHGQAVPDFIIVTHPDFLSAANRLADFRRTKNSMKVLVLTTKQIYNEFSSGAQDVSAIRDMARFFFQKGGTNSNFKYLMLMGGASYDFKDRLPYNTNYVPVYESIESLNTLSSFSSDDYFGLLDDDEGEWSESNDYSMLDVGIGRVPASNIDQANAMVDKFISYSTNTKSYNSWRNRLAFIADDDDTGLHSNDANRLANYVNINYPQFLTSKLYLDFYIQENTPVGQYCPDIERDIDATINQGALIMNYTGHGREIGLASENIITIPRIQSWTNKDNYTFFITATCEFGRYDDPELYSGGHALVLTPNAAAVGVLTTTRVVFAFSNYIINDAFYKTVFTSPNGVRPLMGDIMATTKNLSLIGVNNRNFVMFGDPTLKLAYPENKIVLTQYNNQPIVSGKDTVSALQKVTFGGELRNGVDNTLMTDFNGDLAIRYFDKADTVYTRGDQPPVTIIPYMLMKDFIYDGKVSVVKGKFQITFVVPKDISYQYGYGKISLYASNDAFSTDAAGNNDSILLGGSVKNGQLDNIPPLVKLFMNDESFVFGGTTNTNSTMLVKLSDENGINVAGSGIGHEITAVFNEKSQNAIVLNQYYSTTKDDFTKGSINYNVKDLPEGNNTLRVKAWDVYNNSGEGYLEFVVANTSAVALNHVLNYPNPFSNNTNFHFDHNRAGDDLDVMVQVYTISGILIKTLHANYISANAHIGDISWNGKDDFGDKIGNGVYIYKVSIRSNRDGGKSYQYQKLVLLN